MTYTSVSSKYQVVIPKEIREKMAVKPGQKFVIYERGGVIHLIPDLPLKKLRGLHKNLSLDFDELRDKSDRPL